MRFNIGTLLRAVTCIQYIVTINVKYCASLSKQT
jgi:hypothetical protein